MTQSMTSDRKWPTLANVLRIHSQLQKIWEKGSVVVVLLTIFTNKRKILLGIKESCFWMSKKEGYMMSLNLKISKNCAICCGTAKFCIFTLTFKPLSPSSNYLPPTFKNYDISKIKTSKIPHSKHSNPIIKPNRWNFPRLIQ